MSRRPDRHLPSGDGSEVRADESCLRRVAEVLLADYASEYQSDHLSWEDFEQPAKRVIEAAASLLRERAALIPPPGEDEPFSDGFNSAVEVLTDYPAWPDAMTSEPSP